MLPAVVIVPGTEQDSHLQPSSAEVLYNVPKPNPRSGRTMVAMGGPGQRFYEDEEAEQILRMASSMSSPAGKISYERLLETAAELGISPAAVDAAEKQLVSDRLEHSLHAEFDSIQRREFIGHLTTCVLVCAFLLFVNFRSAPGHFWVQYLALVWGIGLAVHARLSFFKEGEHYKEGFSNWRERRGSSPETTPAQNDDRALSPQVVIGVTIRSGRRNKLRRLDSNRVDRRNR